MVSHAGAELPGTSRRLLGEKFDGILEESLEDGELVLDTIDGDLEVLEYQPRYQRRGSFAIVLTDRRLLCLSGRGKVFGKGGAQYTLQHSKIIQISAGDTDTRVRLKFAGDNRPRWWQLCLFNEEATRRWIQQIAGAAGL